jgi:hypothetical protein
MNGRNELMANLEDLAPDRVADAVARAVVDAVASGGDVESIVSRALAAAERDLGISPNGGVERHPGPTHAPASILTPPSVSTPTLLAGRSNGGSARTVVTEDDVRVAVAAGQREIRIGPRAVVTALARDAAKDAGIRLVEA